MEEIGTLKQLLLNHLEDSKKTDARIIKIEAVQAGLVRDIVHSEKLFDKLFDKLDNLTGIVVKMNSAFFGNGKEGTVDTVSRHEGYFNNLFGGLKLISIISLISGIVFGIITVM